MPQDSRLYQPDGFAGCTTEPAGLHNRRGHLGLTQLVSGVIRDYTLAAEILGGLSPNRGGVGFCGGSMFQGVLDFLKTQFKPGPGAFLLLDAAVLIDKLELKQRGAAHGEQGQPPPDAEVLSAVEEEIVSALRRVASEAEATTHDQIRTYAQRLKAADPAGTAADIRTLAREAEGDFAAEVIAAQVELKRARRDLLEHEKSVKSFKLRHGLERPVEPHKSRFILTAILILLFAIETLPNAVLLGEGEELGVLGGYTVAIVFSFVNLTLGFTGGRVGWTNCIHKKALRKLAGLLMSIGSFGSIVWLNLALAHYRGLVSTMPAAQAAKVALQAMQTTPFEFDDLKSAILTVVGVIFAMIAAVEGWLWSDPYPGYARIDRHLRQVEDQYLATVQEKLAYLKEVQERFIEKIRVERSRLRDRRDEAPIIFEERRRLIARYRSHLNHLQDVGRTCLAAYRDANRRARKVPAPAYFNHSWVLDGFEEIAVSDEPYSLPESEYKAANEALEASIGRLQNAYEQALQWVKRLQQASDPQALDFEDDSASVS